MFREIHDCSQDFPEALLSIWLLTKFFSIYIFPKVYWNDKVYWNEFSQRPLYDREILTQVMNFSEIKMFDVLVCAHMYIHTHMYTHMYV